MHRFLLLFPAILFAQTPPPATKAPAAAKPAAAAPKPAASAKPAAPKPAASAKPAAPKPATAKPTAAVKPAAPKPAAPKPITLTTDDEKTIYSIGLSIQRSLGQFELSPAEIEIVKRAISDGAEGKPAINIEEWGPRIQTLATARAGRLAEKEKETSRAYLVKAAAEPGAVKTESGLVYMDLAPGSGDSPKASDTVKVHYRGTLVNGTEFDSSYKRNEPAQFPLTGVIKCWTEGVQKMKVGGKAKLSCPSDIAYGDRGRPTIPGGAALIFEIELLEIVKAQ